MKQYMKNGERLLSLDALRGFDMFFIMGGGSLLLAVASFLPADCAAVFAEQLGHKEWHGLAFYDLIFPLFLFLAGVSFPLSLDKQLSAGKDRSAVSLRCVRRGLMLILLGVLYNGLLQFDFENLRYASVLGRIGSAWMIASLVYLWLGKKGGSVCVSGAVARLLGPVGAIFSARCSCWCFLLLYGGVHCGLCRQAAVARKASSWHS